MGAGAAKPGTPAVGGKGAAQPSRPTLAPAQGASMPAQGGKAQPSNTLPAPGQAATVPAQGGKAQNPDGTYTGNLGIPPQGGKSQADIDRFNADMAARQANNGVGISKMFYAAGGGQQPTTTDFGQPQVPAQGGKGGGQGGNPEQLAYLQSVLDASRPQTPSNVPSYAQPYVDAIPRNALNANIPMQDLIQGQNTPMAPSNVPAYAQPYVNALQPQVIPQQRSSNPTDVLTPLPRPAPVMPAMAAKPGIAGIAQRAAQMRAQQQAAKGRR